MAGDLQVVKELLPEEATSEQRLKEEGVTWIFLARIFQVEGTACAKALR